MLASLESMATGRLRSASRIWSDFLRRLSGTRYSASLRWFVLAPGPWRATKSRSIRQTNGDGATRVVLRQADFFPWPLGFAGAGPVSRLPQQSSPTGGRRRYSNNCQQLAHFIEVRRGWRPPCTTSPHHDHSLCLAPGAARGTYCSREDWELHPVCPRHSLAARSGIATRHVE